MANSDRNEKALSIFVSFVLASTATAAHAGDASKRLPVETTQLQSALEQIGGADVTVQSLKKMSGDRDQGDENASPRAKEVVCTKTNPASQRSAICDTVTPN